MYMTKPKIGVTPLWDEKMESLWMLPGYFDGVLSANGIPVMLPLTTDNSALLQIAEDCDGFLFTGGHDVSPAMYGEEKHPQCAGVCETRDAMESVLFREAVIIRDKPAFGICRGIQIFNAILGGMLYQDLPSQKGIDHVQKPPYDAPMHKIRILPDTPLYGLVGVCETTVNSYHHQAVKILSAHLTPMAESEDGLYEAVYMPGKAFVWAVQWHPEFWLDSEISVKLFRRFVESCIRRKDYSRNVL
jgi:putative glutamine amidotransferase